MKGVIFGFKIVSALYIGVAIFLFLATCTDYFLGLYKTPVSYGSEKTARTVSERLWVCVGRPILLFSARGRKFMISSFRNIL